MTVYNMGNHDFLSAGWHLPFTDPRCRVCGTKRSVHLVRWDVRRGERSDDAVCAESNVVITEGWEMRVYLGGTPPWLIGPEYVEPGSDYTSFYPGKS
jgi:hypothetical protein